MTEGTNPNQHKMTWQLYNDVAQISTHIEDEVRALIVELAGLDESSETLGEAIAALKHLEVITEHLNQVSENLKPKPSLSEVLANLNEQMGVSIKKPNS